MRQNRRNTMYCPQEKALEMSNTLLAANRRAANNARKNKRNWHSKRRAARRNIDHRFEGVSVDNALDMVDDYEEASQPRTEAIFAKVETERKYDVFDRREGDRLNLYFRWAEKVTDHLDTPEERMNYIAENTPVDPYLISHALLHLSFTPKFRDNNWRWYDSSHRARMLRMRAQRDAKREHVRHMIQQALLRVIERDKHSEFNNSISKMQKVVYKYDNNLKTRVAEFLSLIRPFEGLHDIDDFAEEVTRVSFSYYWRNERSVIGVLERCAQMKID